VNQGLVSGREDFKDKIEEITQRQARRGKDGRPRIEEIPGNTLCIEALEWYIRKNWDLIRIYKGGRHAFY
jgi:hypothetical protein